MLRYMLRPPITQERIEQRGLGLVRITLKKVPAAGDRGLAGVVPPDPTCSGTPPVAGTLIPAHGLPRPGATTSSRVGGRKRCRDRLWQSA